MRALGRLPAVALAALVLAAGGASGGPSPAAAPARATVLDVPFVAQSEALCGGAAAAMVLRYWGRRDVFAEDFAPLVEPRLDGIRAERLASALVERGFDAHVVAGDEETLQHHLERGRPPILLLEVAPGRRHYVVAVASSGGNVVFHDPADRPFRVASREAIQRAWQATGRLMLLALPRAAAGSPGPEAAPRPANAEAASGGCGGLVAQAVDHANAGDLAAAEDELQAAVALCPGAPLPRRELAGVRFRQQRYDDASALAQSAVATDPADTLAWRLLATSRYLGGDEEAALAAWNAVGEPSVDLVRVEGLDRTRPAVVSGALGITPRDRLTPQLARRAARRLAALPTVGPTRLHYRPVSGGRVEVVASVAERPVLPRPLPFSVRLGLDALTRRETRIGAASLTGDGGWLEVGARWQQARPAGWLAFEVPGGLGLPGVALLEALYDEQTYALPGDGLAIERTRRASFGVGDWLTADLNARLSLSVERDRHAASRSVGSLRIERRLLADRAAAVASISGGLPLGSGARFGGGEARLAWRNSASATATVLTRARLGVVAVSKEAPLAYWPGAGTGTGRDLLLRAHPLLADGVLAGEAFGRTLLHGGAEIEAPQLRIGPLGLRAAAFVDVARPTRVASGAAGGRWLADVGVGLRLRIPTAGTLRVDVATGRGAPGATLSAGWQPPWPD